MKVFTIGSVREAIAKLRKNDCYSKCCDDLCGFFQNKQMLTIFNEPFLIFENRKHFRFIKSRISNSDNNKGQSSGYRVYYFADLIKEEVYIIAFYPKTGKHKKSDISNEEEKQAIHEFKEQRNGNTLVAHNLEMSFGIIF